MSLSKQVLVLNASYEAINVCTARRALMLVLAGAAAVEEVSDYVVKTPRMEIPVPSVIRILKYTKMFRKERSVSRKGILLRDKNTCQYCGKSLPAKELTLDHVNPRAKGGGNTWENLVACCWKCNNKKGDRTPKEAGMSLARVPKQIGFYQKHRLLALDEGWDKYLFCR